MIQIQHFTASEFVCKCCGKGYVDSTLVLTLDYLRSVFGHPIVINSGWRCPKHNAEVGGAEGSRHLIGIAADIAAPTAKYVDLLALAAKFFRRGQDGFEFIAYPKKAFIHVAMPRGFEYRPWTGGYIHASQM